MGRGTAPETCPWPAAPRSPYTEDMAFSRYRYWCLFRVNISSQKFKWVQAYFFFFFGNGHFNST